MEAAIAYFSTDKNIVLRKGDVLVVNATTQSIRSGATSARVLRRLHRKGVRVYSRDSLHAKVILAHQQAIVGSANSSVSSSKALDEAAIMTTNAVLVSQARSFVHQLAVPEAALGPDDLERLCFIKVMQAPRGTKAKDGGRRPVSAPGDRTWIVATNDLDPERYAHEEAAVGRATRQIKRDYPDADPNWIRWTGLHRIRKAARAGDLFIVMSRRQRGAIPYLVSPPSSVLRVQKAARWTRFYYDPELARPFREIGFGRFKALCRAAGIGRRLTSSTVREVSAAAAFELARLWPTTKRKK